MGQILMADTVQPTTDTKKTDDPKKKPETPEQAAKSTVDDVHKQMKEKGADAAYSALKQDYDHLVKDSHGNRKQEEAYWKKVTSGLKDVLPALAIEANEKGGLPQFHATHTPGHKDAPGFTTRSKDGSTQYLDFKDNSVTDKDAAGHVTGVHYSDGKSRSFGYDSQGQLNHVQDADGTAYNLQNGKWMNGNTEANIANPKVGADGTFSYQGADSTTQSFTRGDVHSQVSADGSTLHFDANNKPTEVDYKDGKKAQFGYDANGAVNKITNADGATVTLTNGKWLDASGKDTQISDVRVQPDGSYWYASNGVEHIQNTNDKQQTFDLKSIDQAAQDIKAAKDNRDWLGLHGAPDTNKIWNTMEPMSSAQRQLLQERYAQENPGHTLLGDLKEKLSGPDAARAEAVLKRQDGVADNTGQVYQALAKLKDMGPAEPGWTDDNRMRAEKEIRDSINTLTADQLKSVEAKYKKDYGVDLQSTLINDGNLSAESKQALQVYFKGTDHRTDADTLSLANMALQQNRPDIFDESFRDASQSARDQFAKDGGMAKIDDAFTGGDVQIAKDYASRGAVSIATIANGDTHWYHTNKDDITRAVANAEPQDRQDFIRGEQLAQAGQQPQNDADKRALDYYNNVDKALTNSGDAREKTEWEAKLRNNESVITNILDSHTDGSWFFNMGDHTDKNKEMQAVENMSSQDWQYLKSHPDEVSKIDKALGTFNDSNHDEVMNMLRTKLAANDFDSSKQVGNRALTERLADNSDNTSARVDALTNMTADERQRYQSNSGGFRDQVNNQLQGDQEKFLADQMSRTSGDPTALDKALADGIKNDNPASTFSDMEAAFKADPTLRDRMNNPQTAADKQLSQYLHAETMAAVDKAGLGVQADGFGDATPGQYDAYAKAIFQDGHVPLDMQMQLTSDKSAQMNMVMNATDAERARLLDPNPSPETKAFQDSVLGTDSDQRQLMLTGLQQVDPKTGKPGYLDQADQLRQFVVQGGDQNQVKAMLSGMTSEQRQNLANEYFQKYHKLVSEDVIGKVSSSDQWRYRELLSPTDVSARQSALDAQLSNDSHTSSWDDFMKKNWDYSRVSADGAADNLNKFMAQHSAELDNLPPEQRKALNDAIDNYMTAQKNYVDSKGQMAESLTDAAITVAAIGGAVFTGGTSLALLAAVGAGGAVFRTAAMSSIEGTDFDSSAGNILKQGFEGGTAAMLGFLGPEALGLKGLAVGEDVAAVTTGKLLEGAATKGLFKEGSEQVLKEGLAQMTREGAVAGSEKGIAALVDRVAGEGVDRAVVEQAIKNQLKHDTMTGIKNFVLNEGDAYVRNLLAAQIGAQGKEVLATAAGFESPDTLLERMKGTAIGTAAGVTFFHGLVRSATAGREYVKIALGKDGAGNFIAGAGTPIRHADGTIDVVPEGKTYTFKKGDTVSETANGSGDANAPHPEGAHPDAAHPDATTPEGASARPPVDEHPNADRDTGTSDQIAPHDDGSKVPDVVPQISTDRVPVENFGRVVQDKNGAITEIETKAGHFQKVSGKPDTWVTATGKEVKLTNMSLDGQGNLTYKEGNTTFQFDHATGEYYTSTPGNSSVHYKSNGNVDAVYGRNGTDRMEAVYSKNAAGRDELTTLRRQYFDSTTATWKDSGSLVKTADGWVETKTSTTHPTAYGKDIEVKPDGTVTFKGELTTPPPNLAADDSYVGRSVSSSKIDGIDVQPDGARTFRVTTSGAPREFSVDRFNRLTQATDAKGVKADFEYQGSSKQPSKATVDGHVYQTTPPSSKLIDTATGKPFAENMSFNATSGIYQFNMDPTYRLPGEELTNHVVSSITRYSDGTATVSYKDYDPGIRVADQNFQPQTANEAFQARIQANQLRQTPDGWIGADASGGRIVYDNSGKVTGTILPDRSRFLFRYGTDGKIESYTSTHRGVSETVRRDSAGNFERVHSDGTVTPETVNHEPVNDITVKPDGSVTRWNEKFQGERTEADGTVATIDSFGHDHVTAAALDSQRARLSALSSDIMGSQKGARMDQFMSEFEKNAQKNGLTNEEIANSYYQINKMLSSQDAIIPLEQRQVLAQQLMLELAKPRTIDQGQWGVCNVVAEIQNRFAVNHPAELARLAADVSTTGRFVDSHGSVIDMTYVKGALTPQPDVTETMGQNFAQPSKFSRFFSGTQLGDNFSDIDNYADGKRNFLDQILQTSMVNEHWQTNPGNPAAQRASTLSELRNGLRTQSEVDENFARRYHPGDVRYEIQGKPLSAPRDEKNLHMVTDYSHGPNGKPIYGWKTDDLPDPITGKVTKVSKKIEASPNLTDPAISDIGRNLLGFDTPPHFFVTDDVTPGGSLVKITSESELGQKLMDLKNGWRAGDPTSRGLPATIAVAGSRIAQNGVAAGGGPINHLINVQDIWQDPATGKYMMKVTNSWGARHDWIERSMPLDTLWRYMHSTD